MTAVPTGSTSAAEHAFDTSSLAMLRQWLERNPAVYEQLGAIARFKLVIDANFVLADLRYRGKHPMRGPTALEELVRSTVFEVHAPRWLETEIAKHLPLIAQKSGLDLNALQQHWLQYQALLHWNDSLFAPDYGSHCEDPKDLPYVRLAARIGAFGILTVDSDIAAMGGHMLPRDFVISARLYARAATVSFSLRALGITLSGLSLQALLSMVQTATRKFLALPEAARLALVAGFLLMLVHPGHGAGWSHSWRQSRCSCGRSASSCSPC